MVIRSVRTHKRYDKIKIIGTARTCEKINCAKYKIYLLHCLPMGFTLHTADPFKFVLLLDLSQKKSL